MAGTGGKRGRRLDGHPSRKDKEGRKDSSLFGFRDAWDIEVIISTGTHQAHVPHCELPEEESKGEDDDG